VSASLHAGVRARAELPEHVLAGLPDESKVPCQLFTSHPAVVEDLAQQTRSDRFLSVNGNDRDATIRMPEEVMTPPDSNDLESESSQRADELLAG
jgi:hypothetical protein